LFIPWVLLIDYIYLPLTAYNLAVLTALFN